MQRNGRHILLISIHALLAESDLLTVVPKGQYKISIHALLAESDEKNSGKQQERRDFYPRSPCGERRQQKEDYKAPVNFYPRSPCGERPVAAHVGRNKLKFLSTLSLRRATVQLLRGDSKTTLFLSTLSLRRATGIETKYPQNTSNFYPRSPCGERRLNLQRLSISCLFLSTLSLRRATRKGCCRCVLSGISIHALLAESDCVAAVVVIIIPTISIHALLAESDLELLGLSY